MSEHLNKAKGFFPDGNYEALLDLNLENVNNDKAQEELQKLNHLIDLIQKFVEENGRNITTTQLRNIFAAIKEVPEEDRKRLSLLRPKIAYIAARQQRKEARIFTDLIGDLMKKVQSPAQFKSLKTLLEAIVAYHKYYYNN